jgi:hypothetical protein
MESGWGGMVLMRRRADRVFGGIRDFAFRYLFPSTTYLNVLRAREVLT